MKTILCIDDDQDILDTLKMILNAEGYNVLTSTSPANIFELIQQANPSLILLDININGFNGLEICKALKSYVNTKHTPVIMVSSDPGINSAISEYGATDILPKPFTVKKLVDMTDYYSSTKVIPLFPENTGTDIEEVN